MFEVNSEDSGARCGVLSTKHGIVDTPAFMPVATKGSVKTLSSEEVISTATQALICNAFHLYLKPGVKVIAEAGGLHDFMNWKRAIFTDSGGFQMLRKEFLIGASKRGIAFRSPYDRSRHLLTPEKCLEIQGGLGSDIAMALDDLPSYGSGYERVQTSVKRTVEWGKRCKDAKSTGQQLFAITQGGLSSQLRRECVEKLVEIGFDGYGIGGLSIGEPKDAMYRALEKTIPLIPGEKPRYLMGVGSPIEILEAISRGIDVFDSAFPTRNARHNTAYTKGGKLNLTKGKFREDFSPLEEGCRCMACKGYTRAYIFHLIKVREPLCMKLITIHNIHFLQELMRGSRAAIEMGEFTDFKNSFRGY